MLAGASRLVGLAAELGASSNARDEPRRHGAHLLSDNAEEVINLFGLAVRTGIRAGDLKHVVSANPTGASDLSSML